MGYYLEDTGPAWGWGRGPLFMAAEGGNEGTTQWTEREGTQTPLLLCVASYTTVKKEVPHS